MQAPAAGFIEAAVEQLKKHVTPDWIRNSQRKELISAVPTASEDKPDFINGYELGLETARIIIMTNMKLNQAGIDPKDIL